MAEVYGNLVILVILVMEGVDRAALCRDTIHHRHALYDSRRLTDRHWLCTASMATHAVLGVCMSLTEALCLSVTSTGRL